MRYKNIAMMFVMALLLVCGNVMAQDAKLSTLLSDMGSDDLGAQERSQQQWQKICMAAGAPGNADALADVNKQMVEQLDKDIAIVAKVWLLRQLGWTGDASVVPAVAALLSNSEVQIRDAAARALSTMTAPEALDALKKALADEKDAANKKRLEDAIAAKTNSLKVGVETQMPQALPYVSDADAQKWLAGYDKLSNDDKCRTLASLAVRNDKKYRKYALDAIKSDNDQLKRTGILALEKLGTVDDLPLLLDLLAFDGGLVTRVASRIADDKFDDALIAALTAEKDNGKFEAIGRILVGRNVTAAGKALLDSAKKEDCPNRLGYLQIAADVATKDNVKDMVEVMVLVPAGRDRDRAETIIAGVCRGDAAPVIASRERMSPVLFSLLGRIGGDQSRDIINQNLKSETAIIRDAALKGLCNWPNATAAADMMAVVENDAMPQNAQIQALRAYVRVISLPDDQIGIRISSQNKLASLKKAMSLATRVDEKRLVIDRISAVRLPESVTFVLQYIDDDELAQNVCRTVAELAHQDGLRRSNKDVFVPAMEKVLEVSTDNGIKDRIRRYQTQM